jgi:cytoskeletal protein CcmA (bactofilin family)
MSLVTYTRKLFSKQAVEEPCRDELHISGIFVHNDIVALNDVCVTQSVTGNIYCTKNIIVGKNAQVIGNIYCRQGIVEGNVTGNISAFEMLEVKESAVLNGNISARKLNVSPAAILNGYIKSISLKAGRSIHSDIKFKIDEIKYPDMEEENIIPEIVNFDNFNSTVEYLNLNNEVSAFAFQPEKMQEAVIGDNNGKWW